MNKENKINPVRYYYVYVLQSKKDNRFYTGYTANLKARLKEHQNGRTSSIANRRPLRLVYYEACLNSKDASNREKYLKTTWGKRYIKNRLKNFLRGQ